MRTISKETLVEFARTEDYAYLYGAGFMTANNPAEKDGIASIIEECSIIECVTGDMSELPCAELSGQQQEGCVIYKCHNSNEEALYIAYFN